MPELPDITVYLRALSERIRGDVLTGARLASPFVLRSVDPPLATTFGKRVTDLLRLGKRVVLELDGDDDEPLYLVLHLMIAGRLQWKDKPGHKPPGRIGLAAFDFSRGTLLLTEASQKKRASLHVVRGRQALSEHDPGGLEVLEATLPEFRARLCEESHTLKRALTDPRSFSGIGNAYSDEILHRARLSPVQLTSRLDDDEIERLWRAVRGVLVEWSERLDDERRGGFPEKVTAFREEMAVHGRYRQPCPVCGTEVQRIVYAQNETNYCPRCQTGGKLLADRSLSRLLKKDWPKSIEELEVKRRTTTSGASSR